LKKTNNNKDNNRKIQMLEDNDPISGHMLDPVGEGFIRCCAYHNPGKNRVQSNRWRRVNQKLFLVSGENYWTAGFSKDVFRWHVHEMIRSIGEDSTYGNESICKLIHTEKRGYAVYEVCYEYGRPVLNTYDGYLIVRGPEEKIGQLIVNDFDRPYRYPYRKLGRDSDTPKNGIYIDESEALRHHNENLSTEIRDLEYQIGQNYNRIKQISELPLVREFSGPEDEECLNYDIK